MSVWHRNVWPDLKFGEPSVGCRRRWKALPPVISGRGQKFAARCPKSHYPQTAKASWLWCLPVVRPQRLAEFRPTEKEAEGGVLHQGICVMPPENLRDAVRRVSQDSAPSAHVVRARNSAALPKSYGLERSSYKAIRTPLIHSSELRGNTAVNLPQCRIARFDHD